MAVNKVILVGNLGADPEIRATQTGNSIANLRLATTERRKDQNGDWTNHTEWHKIACFGKTAENVGKFCKKGKQLYIEGRLSTRKWQDRDGNDRWTTEVIAFEVKFLSGGRSDDDGGGQDRSQGYSGGSSGASRYDAAPSEPASGGYGGSNAGDDDIPF